MSAHRLIQDGPFVAAIDAASGETVFRMPWNQALEYSKEITALARRAEAVAKAEKLVFDQAVSLRTGFPFGFTNDPKLNDLARKEAGWNEKLRKWFKLPDIRRPALGTPNLVGLLTVDGKTDARSITLNGSIDEPLMKENKRDD